jgi:hypothetical protein
LLVEYIGGVVEKRHVEQLVKAWLRDILGNATRRRETGQLSAEGFIHRSGYPYSQRYRLKLPLIFEGAFY